MSLSVIRSALVGRLATWAAAQATPLLIAREGVPFPPAPLTDKPSLFLEALIIPADTVAWSVRATDFRYLGTFQINVWSSDSVGPGRAEAIVESLVALFPIVPKTLLPVSIESVPSAHMSIV